MKQIKIVLIIIACAYILAACKKDKTISEIDNLPAATQTSANTFGCLINGKIYVPKGFDGNNSNYRLFVDPTFQNGSFQIRIYSFQNSKYERININSNDIHSVVIFSVIGNGGPLFIDYNNDNGNCNFSQSANCYLKGFLHVTRYDVSERIFSGIFQFDIKDPNFICDTIRISEGRFDKKL